MPEKEKGRDDMEHIFDWEKILSFCNYIFYFLVLNILFLFSNLPFLFFYFSVGIDEIGVYLPFFLLCTLPAAPALCGLIHSIMKLFEYKDIHPMREYWKGYKRNGKQACVIGMIQLIAVFVLTTNIKYFKSVPSISAFAIIFMILFAIIIIMTPFLYLLLVRYDMTNIQILKASLAVAIGKPIYTIGNIIICCFVLIMFEWMAGTTFLFIGSLYVCLLVLSNKKLFEKLERR